MTEKKFNYDHPIWCGLSRITDLFFLNLLFIVCSIPIFTIGATLSAMYSVTLKMAKNEEGYVVKGFFKAFRENFRQSTIVWLIMLAVGIVLGLDLYYVYVLGGEQIMAFRYLLWGIVVIYLMIFSYVFPLISKFENTIKVAMRNAALMSFLHLLPWSVSMAILNAIPLGLLFCDANLLAAFMLPMILIGFSAIAYFNGKMLNHVFENYIQKEAGDEECENQMEKFEI